MIAVAQHQSGGGGGKQARLVYFVRAWTCNLVLGRDAFSTLCSPRLMRVLIVPSTEVRFNVHWSAYVLTRHMYIDPTACRPWQKSYRRAGPGTSKFATPNRGLAVHGPAPGPHPSVPMSLGRSRRGRSSARSAWTGRTSSWGYRFVHCVRALRRVVYTASRRRAPGIRCHA